jgi:hypothetical protein
MHSAPNHILRRIVEPPAPAFHAMCQSGKLLRLFQFTESSRRYAALCILCPDEASAYILVLRDQPSAGQR